MSLPVSVSWDRPRAENASASVSLILIPVFDRGGIGGLRVPVPGSAVQHNVALDDYAVQAAVTGANYVRDVLYNGVRVQNTPFRISPGGGSLQLVIATDGGTLRAKVIDRESHPLADTAVYIVPAQPEMREANLAGVMLTGRTDAFGQYTVSNLRPGKYWAVASAAEIFRTPLGMARLLRGRRHGAEFEIGPNGSVTLDLVTQDLP